MAFSNLFDHIAARSRNKTANRQKRRDRNGTPAKQLRRRRAILQTLEDRRVLAAFTVVTPGDAGSGTCGASACTLRDAVLASNALTDVDTISFDAAVTGTISLTAANGPLLISNPVTISGPGSAALTVRAATSPTNEFRVIDIDAAAGDVTIEGLTISGGRVTSEAGAGIRQQGASTLTIRDSVITGNVAANGGGVFGDLDGTIEVASSTISGNTALFGPGGGIHNSYGDTTLTSSFVSDNVAFNSGGGLFSPYDGTVTITDTEITGNRVTEDGYHGGGVYAGGGALTISGSTISGNTVVGGDGGGLYNIAGDFSVTNSTISGNQANYSGGGIFNYDGVFALTGSTVSGNAALYGDGGGISNGRGALTLTRSTISGNNSVTDGGGVSNGSGQINAVESLFNANTSGGDGGAIATITGGVTLTNSTLSGNRANVRGGGVQSDSAAVRVVNSTITQNTANIEGGGIAVTADNTGESILIHNSIVADNSSTVAPEFSPPALPGTNLEVRSSLIGDGTGTTLAPALPDSNGNFVGTAISPVNPMLSPLASNGGPTQTHELNFGSPAIDSGDNTLAVNFGTDGAPAGGDDSTLVSDQRGGLFQRVANSGGGSNTDMGAFEQQPRPILTVDTNADVVNGDFSPGDRSLRELIELANSNEGPDSILFEFGISSPITLDPALGPIVISDFISIDGPGADQLTIDKNPAEVFRLFSITASAGDVTIRGLSLSGGNAGSEDGGAIFSESTGDLTIIQSSLTGNTAASGGAVAATAGVVSIAASTVANNTATANGGGIAVTGAASELTVVDSTLSSNEATLAGGGIYSENTPVSVSSSTLTLNAARTDGGGIGLLADGNGESLDIDNSIIAANTATTGVDLLAPQNSGSDLDVDFSLIGDNDGSSLTESTLSAGVPQADGSGNLIGGGANPAIDPLLGPLQSNGGPTTTHNLLDGSLAIDAGSAALLPGDAFDVDRDNNSFEALPTDQRGADRTVDALDIGAVELASVPQIGWTDPGDITFGTALDGTQLNASANTTGTFTYTPPAGTVLDAGDGQVLAVNFTPDDPLAFRPASASVMINVLKADPVITWNDPAPVEFGTALDSTQLNASADVAGTFVYDPDTGVMPDAGNQTLMVTFTPEDADNYNEATATVTLVVNTINPVITWDDPAGITFGTALDDTQLNATSDITGTFVYTPAADTVLDAGLGQVLSVTFTPDSSNYNEVTTTVTIDVAKADPVITWNDPDDITVGTELDGTQLNATADVAGNFDYDPPAGTVLGVGDGQQLSATFNPVDTVNYNVVTATVMINVTQGGLDFGDAPSQYRVLLADDGARHVSGPLRLGSTVDAEADGQPSAAADGDGDDEDGVTAIASVVAVGDSATTSSFLVESSGAGQLDAWIDFNGNGDWDDPGEQIAASVSLSAGNNTLSFPIPVGALPGDTAARFRLSTAGGLDTTGEAADGEVEDYIVSLLDGSIAPDVTIILPSGVGVINSGSISVTDGQNELFAAPTGSFGAVTVTGGADDDSVTLNLDEPLADGLSLDGLGGTNTLIVNGDGVDLTSAGSVTAQNFHLIDTSAAGSSTLTIDAPTVAALSPSNKTISILGGDADIIVFTDAPDWRMTDPRTEGADFIRVATNQATGEAVEVNGPADWQNPIEPSDVNNNGDVTAGDALVIINELGRRAFSDPDTQFLDNAAAVDPFPGTYYDQNADGKNTALDALRVINKLAQISNSGGEESEAVLPPSLQSLADQATSYLRDDDIAVIAAARKITAADASNNPAPGSPAGQTADAGTDDPAWADQVDQMLSDDPSLMGLAL